MSQAEIREILQQGKELGTVDWVYFEGGEPFLFYPVLKIGVEMANSFGFNVGLVSNAYWATNREDATEWLRPFAGVVQDLSISCDLYHSGEETRAEHAVEAAERLGIPVDLISIAQPGGNEKGESELNQSPLRYRGRAAERLAEKAHLDSWEQFTNCPYEELKDPSRVHLDPFGYVHICQGIAIGNIFKTPLVRIMEEYESAEHPIIGPIIEGGPAALFQPNVMNERFADACHLCFSARKVLRKRFPEILAPDQMYGIAKP
jgi:MoaA/NifB/PqqE/SkfB family radical SAM enzyme